MRFDAADYLSRMSFRIALAYPNGSRTRYYAEVRFPLSESLRHIATSRPEATVVSADLVVECPKRDRVLASLELP